LLFDEVTVSEPRWADLLHETQLSVTELFAACCGSIIKEAAKRGARGGA